MVRHTDVGSHLQRPSCFGSLSARGFLWAGNRSALTGLAMVMMLGVSLAVRAQPAPSARPTVMAQPGQSYTVRSGDTLDRIISDSLGQTPFTQNFLREAFAQLNPKALPQGARGPLIAGATLRIPDAATLRRLAFPGEPSDTRGAPPAKPSGDAAGYTPDVRQNWIRFP